MLDLACSSADLQTPARVPFVAGLAARPFQELRHWSMVGLNCARCASGTLLLTQVSYLVISSSHSATPIFSPLLVVVEVVEVVFEVVDVLFALLPLLLVAVVVLAVFDVVVLFEDVSAPPHATSRSPKAAHSIRGIKVLFNNWILLTVWASEGRPKPYRIKNGKARGLYMKCRRIRQPIMRRNSI